MLASTRTALLVWVLTIFGLGFAPQGCGSTKNDALSPSTALEPSFGVNSTISVTSAPAGAEVWIGPGSGGPGTPVEGGGAAPARCLGRAPLTAPLTIADVSPGGDLEYSIRYEASRRDGRIAHADRIIRRGGSVRIEADLRPRTPDREPAAE